MKIENKKDKYFVYLENENDIKTYLDLFDDYESLVEYKKYLMSTAKKDKYPLIIDNIKQNSYEYIIVLRLLREEKLKRILGET